jgi:transcriptional regulator with XRE-family HTH domain
MDIQTDIKRFANRLRWVRRQDGEPSYRELQRRMGYSPSSISRVLSGTSFPRWEFTKAFLTACHVADSEINGSWRNRWIELAELLSPLGDDMPDDSGTEPGTSAPAAQDGIACAECGAWVIDHERHRAWHATYVRREPGRLPRRPSAPDIAGTGRPLRSLSG